MVELDHFETRLKDAKFRVLISEKQEDLCSLKRVQLKIYRSYDHDFLPAKTRLDMEKLWFRSSILITPRTWCKNKANSFTRIWIAQHLCMRGILVYRKHTLANSSLESIYKFCFGSLFN
jgi:hypothetical protein